MRLKIFKNRWWVVAGGLMGLTVSSAPMVTNTIGVLVRPIGDDLGWTRSQVTLGLAISGITMGLASVVLGRLMDKYGIKAVALPSIVAFALVMASIGFIPASLATFTLLYATLGVVGAGIAPLPYAKSVAGTFDRQRGIALGIAISGVGIGTALVPQYAQTLVEMFGWRGAYIGLGLLHLAVAFPAVLFLLREPKPGSSTHGHGGRAGIQAGETLPGKTFREALASSTFWFIAVPFLLTAILTGLNSQIVPMLTDGGMTPRMATTVVSAGGIALILGRIGAGCLLDLIFAPYVTIMFFMASFVGIALFGTATNSILPFIAASLIGLGIGGQLDLMAFLVSRYFGLRAFGALYGLVTGVFFVGARTYPFLISLVFDATGSYNLVLLGGGTIMIVASFLISRLGPYAYPVVHERVEQKQEAAVPSRA